MTIENTSGTFEVDQNGVTIHGANLTITNGLPTSELSGENLLMDNASYNGVKINSTDGITVRTNDADISGTIKTSMNASEGIKIQYHNGSGWLDRFKVDSTTGDLIAHNMQLKGGQVINSAGKAVIDLDSGVLNWDELTINGTISADNMSSDWVYTNGIKLSQIEQDGTLEIKNGNTTTFKIDASGNITLGGNISWGDKPSYSYTEISNKPYIPEEYNDSDVRSYLTNKGFTYQDSMLYLNADYIIGGVASLSESVFVGEKNKTDGTIHFCSEAFGASSNIYIKAETGIGPYMYLYGPDVMIDAGRNIMFGSNTTVDFSSVDIIKWGNNKPTSTAAVFG